MRASARAQPWGVSAHADAQLVNVLGHIRWVTLVDAGCCCTKSGWGTVLPLQDVLYGHQGGNTASTRDTPGASRGGASPTHVGALGGVLAGPKPIVMHNGPHWWLAATAGQNMQT